MTASRWRLVGGGVCLVLAGAIVLYFLAPDTRTNLETANWAATSCRILISRMVMLESGEGQQRATVYRVDVRYSYERAGQRYESTRYRLGDPPADNRAAAEATVAKYPPGSVVSCYVDPDDPREAVLEH